MTADHFAHTATLLPSGEVLIVGGVSRFDMDQVLATLAVEVYDPATETFKAIDGLNDARNDHTATLLSDGRVLVVGGSQIVTSPTGERIGRGVSSAELFIPSDFSSLPPPSASFSVDVESGVAPLAVKFAHTTQGPLTSVQWDFGDGTTSTEFSPSHTYTRAGSHSVRLAALGPGGASTILVPDLISVEPGPLASVVVEPTEVVMDIGATQRFTAKPIDEFGNKVSDVLVSWSASFEGGVFDADGVLTASTSAGVYERGMSVQVTQGAVTRTGTANVTIEPDPLARIDVEPSPVIVRPGESLNLTPAGLDRYGNVIPDLAFVFATPADTTLFDSDGKVSEAASGSLYAVSVQAEYKGSRQSALVTVAVAPVWMPTGSMAGPRRSHTATRLDDGRVLIVGWFSSQAELYNPATGAFTATGETHDKRLQGSTATRLNDGRVLIAGGRDGKGQPAQPVGAPPLPPLPDLTSAEIYDPAAGTFTPIGNLSTPRAYHTATLLPDGRVLIAGGQSDPPLVGAVEIYDPATGTFEVAGCLDIERRGHSATLVQNGKVLIAGGSTGVAEAPTEFELYDPELGRTVLEGSCGCGDLTAAALLDGKALIVGSIGPAVLYDPSGESFTVTGTMTSARRRPTATLLDDGRVLVAGGFAGEGDYFTFIDSTELYDPGTGTFSVGPSMTTPRLEHTATVLPGGLVLVVGGESGETTWSGGFELSTAEVLYLR